MRASRLIAQPTVSLFLAAACILGPHRAPSPPVSRQCDASHPVDCQQVAARVFAAEMARPICERTTSQYDQNMCVGPAADSTDRNLGAFIDALETIVGRDAVAGPQRAWLEYRTKQCDAVFESISPGTRAGAAQGLCRIWLARSRMRDLDALFEVPLHH